MDFTDKKIAIVGYGVEGRSVFSYLQRNGVELEQITIADQKEHGDMPDVERIIGQDCFSQLVEFDVVFRSPSVRPDAISTDGKIWSLTNEFFAKCPTKQVIGVTGTKGKGTTSTLVTKILREAGKNVHLVGNIGVPALDAIDDISPDDFAVYELSSFQTWDLQTPPQMAVILMIESDHLDVHTDLQEYYDAKAMITAAQTPEHILVHHPSNEVTLSMVSNSSATKIPYMTNKGAHIDQNKVVIDEQYICSVEQIGLTGNHHIENVCAAVTVAWQYSQDVDAFARAIEQFKGLPHRMEFVRSLNGVEYYNDSQGTLKGPVVAALQTFEDKPRVLIFGGYDKGVDVSNVFLELNDSDTVVLVGDSTKMYEQKLAGSKFKTVPLGTKVSMSEIVLRAQEEAQEGGVVLLSPGHASFDMFKSYVDRGDQFREVVNSLSK